ncbi:MAG: GntR family transcriptional regulator [Tistlia sp.]|uniref:GntR family transcriptional regulator n=1 Tax=Tistlia sp. TaxID=3057121 RepID=UPI0034A57245
MPRERSAFSEARGGVALGAAPRLYQRAYGILAEQIGEGVLAAGARLTESAVAAQFGISRAPARRALLELARSGLLVKAPGRGYRVSPGVPNRESVAVGPEVAGGGAPADVLRLASLPSWERIYGQVEEQIVARIAFADWRLNEAELARHYGVSRTVARDVAGRLQQCGLLRKDERSRWFAPALSPDHIGELYELRWILEPAALAEAAPKVPRPFLAGMRRHLEVAIANAREIGGPTLDALEEEMHVALLGHCGNRTLVQAISLHQSLLIAHRFLYRWTGSSLFETEPFLPEHLEVVERLEAGRVEAAAEALKRHLQVSRERAIARVEVIVREFEPDELPYLVRLSP